MVLQMADRTSMVTKGIIKNALIMVGKFITPVYFIVLFYYIDERVPIILGLPFLAARGALIDVRESTLKIRLND